MIVEAAKREMKVEAAKREMEAEASSELKEKVAMGNDEIARLLTELKSKS